MLTPSQYYQKDLKSFIKRIVATGKRYAIIPNESSIKKLHGNYDYIILPNSFEYLEDIQTFIHTLKRYSKRETRIVVFYFNFLWKPLLDTASLLGLRKKSSKEPNWLNKKDISNLFVLEDFDEILQGKRFLFPFDLGAFSYFINRYIAQLPLINHLCLTTFQVYRKNPQQNDYSVSIIIPARSEEGNIRGVLKKIPILGLKTEVIFVEGNSKDNTFKAIKDEISQNRIKRLETYLYKQKGKGKADAVRLGFKHAKNDILMILDADLTVDPKELRKFYSAMSSGKGEFISGSRLVYPMQQEAMRTLNYIGNIVFSRIFTFLLGQTIKDTLCGTKVLFQKDYEIIARNRSYFGNFDPFGDFDLLFGAARQNLKIVEIPIRYKERTYGSTNISRMKHGFLLLKMTVFAMRKLKFV